MFRRASFHTLLGAGLLIACLWAALGTVPALAASGGDMPWDPLLDRLVANIGGPTLARILILAIIGAGIGFYFAHEGTWIRSAFGLVIGFSIACAAATWGPGFFGIAAASPVWAPTPPPLWMEWVALSARLSVWYGIVTVLGQHLRTLLVEAWALWRRTAAQRAGCRERGTAAS
jgi:type IV secretion system protein TrbC